MDVLYVFPVFLASNGEGMMVDEPRWTTRMDSGGQETPFLFAFYFDCAKSILFWDERGGSARCSGSMSLSSSFHSGSCAHIGLHRDDSYCFELNNAGVIQMFISFHTLIQLF